MSVNASIEVPESGIAEFLVRRRVAISLVVFGLLMVEDLLTGVIPRDIFDLTDPKVIVGLTCVIGGLLLRSWAAGFLIKHTEVTTAGPYRLVRNPLYLGSFLMVAGFCVLMDDRENLWVALGLLLILYLPTVRREERDLAQRFPDDWARYAATTRRFFPSTISRPQLAGWRLSQWLRSREYNALLSSIVGLLAVKALRVWLT